jgi:hypothetical protein
MTSSNAIGLPPLVGARRNAGTDSTAQASDAHDAKIARFSFSVRSGSLTTSHGVRKRLRGLKQIIEVEGVLVVPLEVPTQWFAYGHSSFPWRWLK